MQYTMDMAIQFKLSYTFPSEAAWVCPKFEADMTVFLRRRLLPCTVKGCSNWYTLSHSGSRMDHLLNHCPAAYPGSRSEREKGRTVSGRSSMHSPCCSMQSGHLSFSLFFLLGCVYLQVCVYVFTYVFICMIRICMHSHIRGGPRIALGIIPQALSTVFFETGSLTHLGLTKQHRLASPAQAHATMPELLFILGLWDSYSRSLGLHDKHLPN